MRRIVCLAICGLLSCGDDPALPAVVPVVRGPDDRDRLAAGETDRFARWLVSQEGDGVVLLLPFEPMTDSHCPKVDRDSYAERWEKEARDSTGGDPLKEGGIQRMGEEEKADIFAEDPLAFLEPQLELLPPRDQLPFADLPGESLYFRSQFGEHWSFALRGPDRFKVLPWSDELGTLLLGDWQDLTKQACMGLKIPRRAYGNATEPARQSIIARARRMGLRYLVVDTALYGDQGLAHLEKQLEPHLTQRYEFPDGSGIVIFELVSPDVLGTSLRKPVPGDE